MTRLAAENIALNGMARPRQTPGDPLDGLLDFVIRLVDEWILQGHDVQRAVPRFFPPEPRMRGADSVENGRSVGHAPTVETHGVIECRQRLDSKSAE